MHHPTDRITHTTAFVTPVVEHWLGREIAQWVHPMKDRSDDSSHHERTFYLWTTTRSCIFMSTQPNSTQPIHSSIHPSIHPFIHPSIHPSSRTVTLPVQFWEFGRTCEPSQTTAVVFYLGDLLDLNSKKRY